MEESIESAKKYKFWNSIKYCISGLFFGLTAEAYQLFTAQHLLTVYPGFLTASMLVCSFMMSFQNVFTKIPIKHATYIVIGTQLFKNIIVAILFITGNYTTLLIFQIVIEALYEAFDTHEDSLILETLKGYYNINAFKNDLVAAKHRGLTIGFVVALSLLPFINNNMILLYFGVFLLFICVSIEFVKLRYLKQLIDWD
jgi:hypothetical protein